MLTSSVYQHQSTMCARPQSSACSRQGAPFRTGLEWRTNSIRKTTLFLSWMTIAGSAKRYPSFFRLTI